MIEWLVLAANCISFVISCVVYVRIGKHNKRLQLMVDKAERDLERRKAALNG